MLIVETGEIVPEANTYNDLTQARAFTIARGLDDVMSEPLLIRAMDAMLGIVWKGMSVRPDQPLDWPRTGVVDHEGHAVSYGVVPDGVKLGHLWLAWYISQGSDPATVPEPAIAAEAVGPISTQYAVRGGQIQRISWQSLPNVKNALYGLTRASGVLRRV